MFDIPQRFTISVAWAPNPVKQENLLAAVANHWELSTITTLQSGRPFSVWNGAPSNLKCDNNGTFTTVPSNGVCTSGSLTNIGGDYNLDGGGGKRRPAPGPGPQLILDVGPVVQRRHQAHGFLAIAGFAHDPEAILRAQDPAQDLPLNDRIVNHQDSDHKHLCKGQNNAAEMP